jgi:hypothetical protein
MAFIKMPVARLLVERYKKRHLAAQVRSANGLGGIFKFSEILGGTTYTYNIPNTNNYEDVNTGCFTTLGHNCRR